MTQMKIVGTGVFVGAANMLRISRAAPIGRDGFRAKTAFQNATDLGAAKRRRAACACSAAADDKYSL